MKISVVMATYNGEMYLIEQLNSLREQSKKIDEVLFFDDGSSDKTVDMLNQYISEFQLEDSWHVTVNEKNLGYADNFHKALMAAHGDLIFFSDQDDIWYKNKIEKSAEIMEKHPEIKLLCTDYEPFSCVENAPSIPKKILKRMCNDGSLEKINLSNKNIYIASIGCVMCVRKTFRDQIAPFWQEGWAHDDYVWRMAQCADGCYWFHDALIKRRLHDHNVSMRKLHDYSKRMLYYHDVAVTLEQMYKYGIKYGMNDCQLSMIERQKKAIHLREELVKNGKIINIIKLLPYTDCYHSKKSIFMEPLLAIKYGMQKA